MELIVYIDRITKKKATEEVYGARALNLLYGNSWASKTWGKVLKILACKNVLFSSLYGWWQKRSWTRRKIAPFIKKYSIDEREFQKDVHAFTSFNDFFVRKLKPQCRPLCEEQNVAIIPADGRYLFHQNIQECDGFIVKGKKFNLGDLLGDPILAEQYSRGPMVMARLCPTDYHRFHFPCACTPSEAKTINGALYSVNPIAIKKNISIFTENKRVITTLKTSHGSILYIEVGATNVGTVVQTYSPNQHYTTGSEKGFFSFGGSSLILLFPPNVITFDQDLLNATKEGFEIRCLMGQSMGKLIQQEAPPQKLKL